MDFPDRGVSSIVEEGRRAGGHDCGNSETRNGAYWRDLMIAGTVKHRDSLFFGHVHVNWGFKVMEYN